LQQIICFVSDFGLEDAWVGVCHAVMIEACPSARVVDLGHQIPPFDLRKAAATAAAGVYQLPQAIHLVVVDPGVGAGRRDLCLVSGTGTRLVGPDNGVLIPAANRAGGVSEAISIDPGVVGGHGPLATFHARDVLAPAAAALACGASPSSLGQAVDISSLAAAPFGEYRVVGDSIVGEVIEFDRFGSLRFNIPSDGIGSLSPGAKLEFLLGHNTIAAPFGTTFSDATPGNPVAMVDSSGWLTLALNTGSAVERYNAEPGTPVHVRTVV
jgi:S-adenosylmethionine hydrolase